MMELHNPGMSDADICRKHGWKQGTRLTGTEYFGNGKSSTATIRITAIGESEILAVFESDEGEGEEAIWTLKYRDWALAS